MKPKREGDDAGKARASFYISSRIVDEMRDCVVHLSGPPARLTMNGLAEAALRRELARLRKKYNGGDSFPQRGGGPRRGRPVGS